MQVRWVDMKSRSLAVILLVSGLLLGACDDGTVELSTTSSLVTGTTEAPDQIGSTTTLADADNGGLTATTLVGETVGPFEIMVRISGDNGETLHIVIPPGAYTEVDLENFIGDLKEADPELWGAEVFDDEDAIPAFVIPEDQRTAEQQALVDLHHFVSLVEGDTIRFQGPFSQFGEAIIGS